MIQIAVEWVSFVRRPVNFLAVITGILLFAISLFTRGIVSFKYFGDPLPIIQFIPALLQGFLYLDWLTPLIQLVYWFAVTGLLLSVICWRLGRLPDRDDAITAARIMAVVQVLGLAYVLVDAGVVMVWFGLGIWLILIIVGVAMRGWLHLFAIFIPQTLPDNPIPHAQMFPDPHGAENGPHQAKSHNDTDR